MEQRYYRDFSGEYGTIIRDRENNDDDIYEYGIDDSKELCKILNEQDKIQKAIEKNQERTQNQLRLVYDKITKLSDENERLKIELEDEIIYKNKHKKEASEYLELYQKQQLKQKHYEKWIKEIHEYTGTDEDHIIKFALSYTLQALRDGEDIKRFKWEEER